MPGRPRFLACSANASVARTFRLLCLAVWKAALLHLRHCVVLSPPPWLTRYPFSRKATTKEGIVTITEHRLIHSDILMRAVETVVIENGPRVYMLDLCNVRRAGGPEAATLRAHAASGSPRRMVRRRRKSMD